MADRTISKTAKQALEIMNKLRGNVPYESEEEFFAWYRGALIFLFHDTYGLPVSTIVAVMDKVNA